MMHSPPLFHVKKLVCSYTGTNSKALVMNELIIPRGKLVFLLGASGAGKSTLLETLGIMNNTIDSGEIIFTPDPDKPSVDITSLWQQNKQEEINELRKKHFNFIFQNTNLMENFSAYENVCLSGMIKSNKAQQEIIEGAKLLMEKVRLPENEVRLGTLANNLSGGQRQRVAFVRALNNDAGVLFGDEPTGNLDEVNANELMQVIKSSLSVARSAIIVSHDTNLALRYADIIVVLTKDPLKGYGEVSLQNIYEREFWENKQEAELHLFKKSLTQQFTAAADKSEHSNSTPSDERKNLNRTYKDLFLTRESKVLFGKKYSNLIILAFIFFFTFLSIGFANGSLEYLNQKMNSAFVNWISITVPSTISDSDKLGTIKQAIKDPGNKAFYNYDRVAEYHKNFESFFDSTKQDALAAKGRTVDVELDYKFLAEDVLNDENFISGSKLGFKSNYDISLIVTEAFLQEFGYPKEAQYIKLSNNLKDELTGNMENEYVPIPIRAVVKTLPNKLYFLYPINFFNALGQGNVVFSSKGNKKFLNFFIESDQFNDINALRSGIESVLKEISYVSIDSLVLGTPELNNIEVDTFGYKPGLSAEIEFYPEVLNYRVMDSVWNIIQSSAALEPYRLQTTRTYSFSDANFEASEIMPDQISVYFKDLTYVEEFAAFVDNLNDDDLRKSNRIEVEQNTVKEKKNFLFLSNVTVVISFILILFATASIGLFVYNLVRSHLNKVKMNLGTFKAIGLSDRESISIYFKIILVFMMIGTISGLVLSYAAGRLINMVLLLSVKSDTDMSYFELFHANTLIAFLIVLITALVISFVTIRKILSKSPGDLIYNR